MAEGEVRVHGLRELHSALKRYDERLKHELESELKQAGQIVADDARSRFSRYDEKSAAGFRPRLRGFGRVVVEQRKRRTTGQHPDYGALQMRRALLPAVMSNEEKVVEALDGMLDRLGREAGF